MAVREVPGVMKDHTGTAVPYGYLSCDGSSYATANYPALFARIGYTYGGSGANFSVPNMARAVAMGSGGTGTATIGNAVGDTGGEENHLLTTTESALPSHTHTDSGHIHETAGHSDNNVGTNGGGLGAGNLPNWMQIGVNGASSLGAPNSASGSANIQAASAAAGSAHNTIQPSLIVLKIIKW